MDSPWTGDGLVGDCLPGMHAPCFHSQHHRKQSPRVVKMTAVEAVAPRRVCVESGSAGRLFRWQRTMQ